MANISLHDQIRRHLEDGVRDREQADGDCVICGCHVRPLQQTIARLLIEHFRIADIATVEIVQQVDPGAERNDVEVELPHETPVARPVVEILKVEACESPGETLPGLLSIYLSALKL